MASHHKRLKCILDDQTPSLDQELMLDQIWISKFYNHLWMMSSFLLLEHLQGQCLLKWNVRQDLLSLIPLVTHLKFAKFGVYRSESSVSRNKMGPHSFPRYTHRATLLSFHIQTYGCLLAWGWVDRCLYWGSLFNNICKCGKYLLKE